MPPLDVAYSLAKPGLALI